MSAVASYGHRVSLWAPGPNLSLGLAGEGCPCFLKMGWTQLGPPQAWHLKTVAFSVQQLSFLYTSLEKGMATRSSILAWRIPWTEEPGGLQFMGLQRVRPNWATNISTFSPLVRVTTSFRSPELEQCFLFSLGAHTGGLFKPSKHQGLHDTPFSWECGCSVPLGGGHRGG